MQHSSSNVKFYSTLGKNTKDTQNKQRTKPKTLPKEDPTLSLNLIYKTKTRKQNRSEEDKIQDYETSTLRV